MITYFFCCDSIACWKYFEFSQEYLLKSIIFQVYDAINENPEAPNITFPDADADRAIIDFHACGFPKSENDEKSIQNLIWICQ